MVWVFRHLGHEWPWRRRVLWPAALQARFQPPANRTAAPVPRKKENSITAGITRFDAHPYQAGDKRGAALLNGCHHHLYGTMLTIPHIDLGAIPVTRKFCTPYTCASI